MVEKLGDVVFRRTELGVLGHPGTEALEACANFVAQELAWPESRRAEELAAVEALFRTSTWAGAAA
jgi:glycerol-3-phosphate dehydrogenase